MIRLFFIRLMIKLFYLFPINRRKVFFSSFEGKSMACNPKYIYNRLIKQHGDRLIYIWEFNGSQPKEVKTVRHNSLGYIYHIMTAKAIITNTGISAVFPLRNKQVCINTWHGSGAYKKVGRDIDAKINGTSDYMMKLSNKSTDYFISGCQKFTEVMSNAIMLEKEKFLPIGMPRNDFLVAGDGYDIEEIKRKANIPNGKKIVLYAPTFRGTTGQAVNEALKMDVQRVLSALSSRFGGEWIFAYRCHYHVKSAFANEPNNIDLSQFEDMQELLAVSDVLISDYSSSIWDYSFTYKPCFLFCYDLVNYEKERDFYVPIEKWGFPIALNNEELIQSILGFDEKKYVEDMTNHHSDLGSYESGNATKDICDLLSKIIGV